MIIYIPISSSAIPAPVFCRAEQPIFPAPGFVAGLPGIVRQVQTKSADCHDALIFHLRLESRHWSIRHFRNPALCLLFLAVPAATRSIPRRRPAQMRRYRPGKRSAGSSGRRSRSACSCSLASPRWPSPAGMRGTVPAADQVADRQTELAVSHADSAMFGTPCIPARFVAHPRHSYGYGCGSLRATGRGCAPRHPREPA